MKYLFLTLASLIGLLQLVAFFQNLAGAMDTDLYLLTETWTMNPGMIMFFGFILGGLATLCLILFFNNGKLPIDRAGDFGGGTSEW